MSVINATNLFDAGGYQISRSVRLRSSASAYFNRTATGSGSNTTSTISFWVKRGALTSAANQTLFSSERSAASDGFALYFDTADRLNLLTNQSAGAASFQLITTRVFRDPSAWYHVVLAIDTTQATASNRAILYINGVQETVFTTATYAAQNASIWLGTSGLVNYIGRVASSAIWLLDSYLAEYNVINGQQLTPSSFGTTDSNGIWQPKAYTGTYGTNGFYLKFTDNSAATAAAIGKDYSGNGNNWTPNNISVTAGVTYDSMIDSPTVGPSASNYPVLNPLSKGAASTYANGNLQVVTGLATSANFATIQIPDSGKWYWEYVGTATGDRCYCGIANSANTISVAYYGFDGNKYINGVGSAYGATYTTNDVIGVAVDVNSGSITYYKNNVSQGAITQTIAGNQFFPYFADGAGGFSSTIEVNFGQRPFTYTPPTGFAALNTYNLPAATINNGATVMAASTYTGTGATLSVANSGNNPAAVSFKPDFVWIKNRGNTTSHVLQNSIVGAGKSLFSNSTSAESGNAGDLISSFNSNGFTVNDTYLGGSGGGGTDGSGYNYIGWQWQAGQGTTSSNANGSITSTVSVNQSAGFSIVTYTGTGANATVGHGLGVAPKFVIVKTRSVGTYDWCVYHSSLTSASYYIPLNNSTAQTLSTNVWNATAPTSSVLSIGTSVATNQSSQTLVAYCWSEVAGYSKFGSYTGNGSADGPFIYCGFRPRWIMVKLTSTAGGNWSIIDTSRNTYNVSNTGLLANASNAEATLADIDVTANGFKVRSTSQNINAETYIFAAFAENPFNISRAR